MTDILTTNTLCCQNLTKAYGKKQVLENINLTLEPHKIYGLIGRNGAGKTTLLSILSAQSLCSDGTVTYNGTPVFENESALSHICFSRELNPLMGSNANGLRIKDYLRAASIFLPHWDKEMADSLLKTFELNPKDRIHKLSKGMLSMITILIALASKADYTILDEPVAGLDVVMREKFYQLLLEEYSTTNRTFVISTHILEEAAGLFEEVILIKNGSILLKENTNDLLERTFHISGMEDVIRSEFSGYTLHGIEKLGRSMGATILLPPGNNIPSTADVTVQPVSLQHLFVALCGSKEEE